MRITLFKTKIKMLQYDTKYKKYVIRFIIDSPIEGGRRYTVADKFKQAINLIRKGYN